MAICQAYGNPHLFITYTMNNKAPEFKEMMEDGQTFADRPDIVYRLFIDKANEFIHDITKKQVMGNVKAWFYSVEHQKLYLLCYTIN
jgi:hypothetical protein